MSNGTVVLFILEGPTDEQTLMPCIVDMYTFNGKKTVVKVMHTDILTKFKNGLKEYEVTKSNVHLAIIKCVKQYIKDNRSSYVKLADIHKVYYCTDTDDCFLLGQPQHINEKNCLN